MSLPELFEQIESTEFDANINILSGFRTMLRALENDESVTNLVAAIDHSPEDKQRVFRHLRELLPENPHPEYAHPHDVALAAYLYALNRVDATLAQRAVEHVLQTPKLWWARRLANHILQSAITDPK